MQICLILRWIETLNMEYEKRRLWNSQFEVVRVHEFQSWAFVLGILFSICYTFFLSSTWVGESNSALIFRHINRSLLLRYMHNIIVQYFFIIPRIIRYTKYPCSFFHNSTYPYMVNECNNKSLRKFLNFSVLVNINKNQLSTESAKSEERKQNFMFDTEAFSGVPHRYRWSQGLNCVNSHKLCALSYFCDASRIIKCCKLRSFKVGARLIDFIRAISRLRRLMKCVEKSALRAIHKIDDWKYEKCVLERKFQRHSVIILLFAVTSSRKYISK